MKRCAIHFLCGLVCWLIACPAFGWEFELKGEYELRMRYFANIGNNDLFGVRTLQDVAPQAGLPALTAHVGFAGPNIYGLGADPPVLSDSAAGTVVITRGGFSTWGSDAIYSDSRLTLYPTIRINPAIRVTGVYTIGGYRNKYAEVPGGVGVPPFERYYMSQVSMNAYDTAGIGSWEQFRATVQTPMAIFSYGVKDFPFGIGATFANNTRSETFLGVVPYGPFRFLYGIWLARSRGLAGSPESFGTTPDGDRKNSFFQGLFFTYDNNSVSLGAGSIFRTYHGSAAVATDAFGRGVDDTSLFNVAYFKFNNGQFFANAEYAWLNIDSYRPAAPLPPPVIGAAVVLSPPGGFATERHTESQHAFAEVGSNFGPAKLSFMWAWSPGRQLSNGLTPFLTTPNPTKIYAIWPINYQALEPYNLLMFQTYAGGNNQFNGLFVADGTGMLGDAWSLGSRLDYAIASNLNFWGSYIWAERIEKDGDLAGSYGTTAMPAPVVAPGLAFRTINGGGTNPFAGNEFLGWEANAGIDWKLLEGLTVNVRYAYWQPGDWFKFAYQAIVPARILATGGASAGGGVLQSRDPIQAITGSFLVNF